MQPMKKTPPDNTLSPKILNFSRRRGRPKNNRPLLDTGTPETVMKRLMGITTEALDLCLEKGIITEQQHWCGIHLRWLYTLRYGVPSARTTNLTFMESCGHKPSDYEDPLWRVSREKEYNDALNMLTKSGYSLLLINLCVYNELPRIFSSQREKSLVYREITEKISSGLNILLKLWKKSN